MTQPASHTRFLTVPVLVTDAPVHENVITGDAVDLSALPVPKYSPDDGGPYITSGIVVSKIRRRGCRISAIGLTRSAGVG